LVWVLVAASAYELALALGAGSIGPDPGEDVPGATALRVVGVLAMLAGAGLVGAKLRPSVAALLAPAAALFVVPFYFTFDPYYAPTERRYSDDGMFPLSWIVAVAAAGLVAGILTRLFPRVGAWATIPALLVLAFTAFLMVGGH
jgi:drug/metabolite transporter (DMT)-like permease